MTEEELPLCACGECGLRVTKLGNRFIWGHHRRGKKNSPEHNAKISTGIRNSDAVKAKNNAQIGVPLPSEHCAAIIEGQEESGMFERQRSGNDIVNHHYIYDHSDLSKYTMKMTRSAHFRLHNNMRKAGIKVPHINIKGTEND